jgi:hypothetical protein
MERQFAGSVSRFRRQCGRPFLCKGPAVVSKTNRLPKRCLREIWVPKKHLVHLGIVGLQESTGFDPASLNERIESLDQSFQFNIH